MHAENGGLGDHGGTVDGDVSPAAGYKCASIVVQRGTDTCSGIMQRESGVLF